MRIIDIDQDIIGMGIGILLGLDSRLVLLRTRDSNFFLCTQAKASVRRLPTSSLLREKQGE